MTKWKNNERGFIYTYDNGDTGSVQGPNITPENIQQHADYRREYHKVVKVEEFFYEDTIRWSIEGNQRQIEICLKQIKDLEKELEAL